MTDKHTPGPWEPKRIESQRWEIDAPNGDPLLRYWAWQGLAAVYGNDDNKVAGSQVAKANARLIASAPTLYDAAHNAAGVLIACCKPAGGCDDDHAIHDAIKRLEDAIAKARGEA